MENTPFYVREFLNLPNESAGAYIIASVDNDCDGKDKHCWHNASFDISDCNRVISLYFGMSSYKERKNSFHKIELLIDTLIDFREAMKEETKTLKRHAKDRREREVRSSSD